MAATPTACPALVAAMSAPIEISIARLFNEYGWDGSGTLENLVQLKSTLELFEIDCTPSLGTGDLTEPRVFKKRTVPGVELTIRREVAEGESSTLEFKSSLAFDRKKAQFKPDLAAREYLSNEVVFSALKTVGAFLNSYGGTLLVGVRDDGTFCGVEDDYSLIRKPEQQFDGWELHFRDLLEAHFVNGRAVNAYVAVQKASVDGVCIARVQVAPRSQLTFMRWEKQTQLYVRSGNRSTPIPFEELEHYFDLRKRY